MEAAKDYVMIWVDCTDRGAYSELKQTYQVGGYPTIIFTDSDGELVGEMVGAAPAKTVLAKFEEFAGS